MAYPVSREVLAEQYEQLKALDQAIKDQDRRISGLCNSNALSRRFLDVPVVGSITAALAIIEESVICADDCMDAGGRAT